MATLLAADFAGAQSGTNIVVQTFDFTNAAVQQAGRRRTTWHRSR
jgi:hypothetical protein